MSATVHPFTPVPITRSADHRYTYEGVTYPGVTSILGVLDKSGPLMAWASRMTAEAAVQQIDNLPSLLASVGAEGVVLALTARSSWQRDEAAALGTEVHRLADLVVRSEPTPTMTETTRQRVLHYADWWQKSGWTLRLSEAMVILPDEACGFGGTFDLLARDRDGRTVLADIKTGGRWGRKVYGNEVLQVAAYGMAKFVQPAGSDKVFPLPMVDRYVVIHVTAEGCREIEVSVGTAERSAFLALREVHGWLDTVKGKIA